MFKFFDARVFQEELRGITPEATPISGSEKTFMLALQYTNNRMMNWVACRSLPIDERYAGPQYFGHRLHKDRLDFIPSSFSSTDAPTVRPRSISPGWLFCDVCEKWRRVDADSLKVWDNRFFLEGQVVQASRLLQKIDSGFHKRLKEVVRQRHVQNKVFNLSDLRSLIGLISRTDCLTSDLGRQGFQFQLYINSL